MNTETEQQPEAAVRCTGVLGFDDAVRIARGCFDYSGGHRGSELETYHHGIQTVLNALEAAAKAGLNDTQVTALWRMGSQKPNH